MLGDDEDYELKVGMTVFSDEEAYALYNKYALSKGFSVCNGHLRRDPSDKIRQREFMCSKEGFQRYEDLLKPRNYKRLETRTGCKAVVIFNVVDGNWTISQIFSDHNHELATPKERQFLRSGRNISNAQGDVISSMVGAGIRPVKSYFYLENVIGGAENIKFTKKDVHSYLQRKKGKLMEAGDAQTMLTHFKRKQGEDPNFFYSVLLDQDSCLTNFFWRDSRSKLDYDCFGDAMCFDTTFRTNKYNLICALFVGVNHHWKNVLFGCAFLLDESTKSFVWLFEISMESMGNKRPKTIFTDEDKAIANAMEQVFPDVTHRLCTWHILQNANHQISSLYALSGFKKDFNVCFHDCRSVIEFEASWDKMISNFNLRDHSWLKKLYWIREKWSSAFSLDTFSANMLSTQRSESTNNVFHQISKRTIDLITFVHHYEKNLEEMHLVELEDDYRCKNGTPHLRVKSGMLAYAAKVFTIVIFKMFEIEFLGCMGVRIKESTQSGEVYMYDAIQEGHQRVLKVQYNFLTLNISCTCKLFESLGILCHYALKVFYIHNFTSFPGHYMLKRWTKEVKKSTP